MTRAAVWLAALTLAVFSAAWVATRPSAPDAFYDHSMAADAAPGELLKSEPFARAVPSGGKGWRILYATTRGGKPALASAVVVLPARRDGQDLPVIAWAHGTTGIAAGCAPSLLPKPFDNVPDMDALLGEGWAYVGADYPGLGTGGGHAYLVGEDAARAVLDAVRAARHLEDAKLGRRIVVWGHSQGGNTALWAGMRAAEFAPEFELLGVAALAPASDLRGLIRASAANVFGKIVSAYLITAYAQSYGDVRIEDYVRGGSRILADELAKRCVGGYDTLFSVLLAQFLPVDGMFYRDAMQGPLGSRLRENTPVGRIVAPLLIAQGEADDLVTPQVQKAFVAARCAEGQPVDFRTYPGRDHVSVVAVDSPLAKELVLWTRDRFAGFPAADNCGH